MPTSPGRILLHVLLLALIYSPAGAQYLFVDANRDSAWSSADQLNPDTTTVFVWLNTNHDRDSSTRVCNDHTGAASSTTTLNVFSYDLILHATGGTVTYSTLISPGFNANGTEYQSGTDATVHRTRPLGSTLSGLQLLGYLTVTVASGSPAIAVASGTTIEPAYGTGFGTDCDGSEYPNTYVLGADWFDADGMAAGVGGEAIAASAPSDVELQKGQPVLLVGEFSASGSADSLALGIEGLPPGLHAVTGIAYGQTKQLRVYGALEDSVPDGASYDLTWSAFDGRSTRLVHTTVRSANSGAVSPAELEAKARETVTTYYQHGMSHATGRSLGLRALPLLAQMLRDDRYRKDWHKIAQAIGDIGDTSYFDTLRTFIRNRFHGPIDEPTRKAIRSAQGALSPMATVSPRALDYLIASASSAGWNSIPWTARGWPQERLANVLARGSLIALAYTDSDRASDVILSVPMPADTTTLVGRTEAMFVRALLRVRADVREHGFIAAWGRKDPRLHGGHLR